MAAEITGYDRPRWFVDEQPVGPFRHWRHEHVFTAGRGGTVMHHQINFSAPARPVGRVVSAVVLRPYLTRLIARRNAHVAAALARPPA